MNLAAVLIATSLVFGAVAISAVARVRTGSVTQSHMMLANLANMCGAWAEAVYLAIRQVALIRRGGVTTRRAIGRCRMARCW